MPSVRVKFRSAAVGGIISAVLWEISKRGFYLYVLNVGTMTNFYKQIATIPLFLFWVFLTWIIILLGAEFSYTFQHLKVIMREHEEKKTGKKHSQAFLALSLLFSLIDAFNKDQKIPELDDIADNIGIRVEELETAALTLKEMGILGEDTSNGRHYTLIKNPYHLNVSEIVSTMKIKEFPIESNLGLSSIDTLSEEEREDIQKKVEHIFAHAEKQYFKVFEKDFTIQKCFPEGKFFK